VSDDISKVVFGHFR